MGVKKYKLDHGIVRRSGTAHYLILFALFVAEIFILKSHSISSKEILMGVTPLASAESSSVQSEPVLNEYNGDILFMGDSMFARSVGSQIEKGADPYEFVSDILDQASLTVANIETTIANPELSKQQTKTYTFNSPLSSLSLISRYIDVATTANNHTGDYGSSATADMIVQLSSRGIKQTGLGNNRSEAFTPLIVDVPLKSSDGNLQSVKVGFLAVNDIELSFTKAGDNKAGGAYFDKELIANLIRSAREKGAEFVVVIPHWGIEYQTSPSARQKEWGRIFIDGGADAVVGGHPHVIQPTETYNGKPIVYSMGNFIFDGMSGDARIGQMISLPLKLSTESKPGKTTIRNLTSDTPQSIRISIDDRGFPHQL